MPKATIDPTSTQRFDLKTCPGGYVELRTLSFHEMEVRKDIMGRVYQESAPSKHGKRKPDDPETQRAYFESMNVAVTQYEFRNCITDHNLFMDEEETQKIDFTKPMHSWYLNPKIGEEISGYIDELTKIDEEDDLVPLAMPPSGSSQEEASLSSVPSVET